MHIVTSELPKAANLRAARAYAEPRFAADEVAGNLIYVELPFGPIAVNRDGTCWEAQYIGRADGFTWVTLADL